MNVSPVTSPTFGPDYADLTHTAGITAITAPARVTATRPYAGPRTYTSEHTQRFAAGSLPPMTTPHTAANAYRQAQGTTTQQSLAPPDSKTDQAAVQKKTRSTPIPAHRVNQSSDGSGGLDLTA